MERLTIDVLSVVETEKITLFIEKSKIKASIKQTSLKEEKKTTPKKDKDIVSKETFLADLREGLKEVKEIREGKRKKNTMKDFNEYVQN